MGTIKQLLIEMEETYSLVIFNEIIHPTPIEDEPVNEEKHENEKMDVLSSK